MQVNGTSYQSLWEPKVKTGFISIIDQLYLPHQFVVEDLYSVEDVFTAIKDMHVRGAPLIGVAASYGIYLAALEIRDKGYRYEKLVEAGNLLKSARPTAVNLTYAVDLQLEALIHMTDSQRAVEVSLAQARSLRKQEIDASKAIGEHGMELINKIAGQKNGEPVNILTHCNAGWLACIEYGTATAPIYLAHDKGIPVHVWVDETRPRNQGARLTAWELLQHGVPHSVIADNTGGHLMQHGMVDMVIVGSDRTSLNGDVANKIGTYMKALAANDNGIPFYVALPSSTIDWEITDGINQIPIEKRDASEVKYIKGQSGNEIQEVLLTPEDSPAVNYAFDVTPARLVTGLITEKGICEANRKGISDLLKV